jgi:hypothetical protein
MKYFIVAFIIGPRQERLVERTAAAAFEVVHGAACCVLFLLVR